MKEKKQESIIGSWNDQKYNHVKTVVNFNVFPFLYGHALITTLHTPVLIYSCSSLWRQIGDKIDTHISWPRKHFFASTTVLQVIVCCLRGFVSLFRFIVLFSSGHRWPYFVSWNFSFVISFSSRCRNALVLSLSHFNVASSVLYFVDCSIYKTAIRQFFPPSLHEAHTSQNNTTEKVTEVVSV